MTSLYTKKHHELTHAIGRRLAEIRRARRLGQEALADLTQHALSLNTISILERGLGDPRISTLSDLAEALDIPLSDLVDIGTPAPGTDPDREVQIRHLIRLFQKLDLEKRNLALKILTVLQD